MAGIGQTENEGDEMSNETMSSIFSARLKVVRGRDIDTVEIENESGSHYSVMYDERQALAICRAVNLHDELVEMLERYLPHCFEYNEGSEYMGENLINLLTKAKGEP